MESPISPSQHGPILAVGVELDGVRVCLLENVSGGYRLAGWLGAPRTDDKSVAELSAEVCQRLGRRLGGLLWNERERTPFVVSEDQLRWPPLEHVAVAASPRPHVRVWLAGLSSTQSMAAAKEALTGSPAHIIGFTPFTADLQIGALNDKLAIAAPDMIVVVGGYDNPAADTQQPILELCRVIGQALVRTAPTQRPGVVFAGNRWAAQRAIELLQTTGSGSVEAVDNVQPAPGILHSTALAHAVNFYYWRLCRRMPGFREISRWVTTPGHITSLESSFAQLVQVWMELHDLPELHGLYCSAAWWLHVWASRSQAGFNLRYIEPQTRPDELAGWPPLQLVSGEWPIQLWPLPEIGWWDPSGMAPIVAAVGQVAPQAMLQVLHADLFAVQQG